MRRVASVATAAALLAALAACGAAQGQTSDASCPSPRLTAAGHRFSVYWLDRTFIGLDLTDCEQHNAGRPRPGSSGIALSLIYGDCTPGPGEEGGCSPPLEIQETSVCAVDPLTYDLLPRRRTTGRGALLVRFPNGFTDVYTGTTNVRITDGSPFPMDDLLAGLRLVGHAVRGGLLPMPRFPRSTMRHLRKVRSLYRKLGSAGAVRSRLHISRSAVKDRLDFLHDIEALARSRHTRLRTTDC